MKHLKDCNHCPGPRLSLILEGTGELRHCTLVVTLSSSNPQRVRLQRIFRTGASSSPATAESSRVAGFVVLPL